MAKTLVNYMRTLALTADASVLITDGKSLGSKKKLKPKFL